MSFVYITGAPGIGKTSLQKYFANKGYDARDLDSSALGGPHNKITGELVTIPPAESRTPEWFKNHEWRVYFEAFEKLKYESIAKTIFVFGVAVSDSEIIHIFDKIIYLKLDDETLKRRLLHRKSSDYGKNDFELLNILRRKHALDKKYIAPNAIIIDASKPLEEIFTEIISHI